MKNNDIVEAIEILESKYPNMSYLKIRPEKDGQVSISVEIECQFTGKVLAVASRRISKESLNDSSVSLISYSVSSLCDMLEQSQ